ncbi:uncharacterized protein UBRO2_03651 [Ustilago bromivora]|uniref:Uncharacterized protein n=1 Tax=Ustilago bromivora TaxID=307758 RepID=A0A8H8QN81_9BASI|nr:uncharacterized protein UBRO2_03651 [Ustilago bromivora]
MSVVGEQKCPPDPDIVKSLLLHQVAPHLSHYKRMLNGIGDELLKFDHYKRFGISLSKVDEVYQSRPFLTPEVLSDNVRMLCNHRSFLEVVGWRYYRLGHPDRHKRLSQFETHNKGVRSSYRKIRTRAMQHLMDHYDQLSFDANTADLYVIVKESMNILCEIKHVDTSLASAIVASWTPFGIYMSEELVQYITGKRMNHDSPPPQYDSVYFPAMEKLKSMYQKGQVNSGRELERFAWSVCRRSHHAVKKEEDQVTSIAAPSLVSDDRQESARSPTPLPNADEVVDATLADLRSRAVTPVYQPDIQPLTPPPRWIGQRRPSPPPPDRHIPTNGEIAGWAERCFASAFANPYGERSRIPRACTHCHLAGLGHCERNIPAYPGMEYLGDGTPSMQPRGLHRAERAHLTVADGLGPGVVRSEDRVVDPVSTQGWAAAMRYVWRLANRELVSPLLQVYMIYVEHHDRLLSECQPHESVTEAGGPPGRITDVEGAPTGESALVTEENEESEGGVPTGESSLVLFDESDTTLFPHDSQRVLHRDAGGSKDNQNNVALAGGVVHSSTLATQPPVQDPNGSSSSDAPHQAWTQAHSLTISNSDPDQVSDPQSDTKEPLLTVEVFDDKPTESSEEGKKRKRDQNITLQPRTFLEAS